MTNVWGFLRRSKAAATLRVVDCAAVTRWDFWLVLNVSATDKVPLRKVPAEIIARAAIVRRCRLTVSPSSQYIHDGWW